MKKRNAQLALLDLMLCTIGCTLLIFASQLGQPRSKGRGWDDRPLVVSARAAASPYAYAGQQITFHWRLTRLGAGTTAPGGQSRVLVVPPAGETANQRPVLFAVPEAEFGGWELSLAVAAELENYEQLLADLRPEELYQSAPTSIQEAVAAYRRAYASYLRLREEAGPPGPSARRFLEELKGLKLKLEALTRPLTGGGLRRYYQEVDYYLLYRLAVMRAAADRGARAPDVDRVLADVSADLLTDSPLHKLRWGVRVEEQLRGAALDPDPWAGLTAELKARGRVEPSGSPRDASYMAYVNELIRQRARREHPAASRAGDAYESQVDGYLANRGAAVRRAVENRDLLVLLIAQELQELVKAADRAVVVHLGVAWGDTRWPAAAPAADCGQGQALEPLRFMPREFHSYRRVAALTLDRDRNRPLVTLAAP